MLVQKNHPNLIFQELDFRT